MSEEIQVVIKVIQQLSNMTVKRGCTEAEALSAARKMGEMLKVYNLSMDKVFLGETKCITGSIETGRVSRHPIDATMVAIAEFCDCKIWFSKGYKSSSAYKIFGMPSDVEMAKYLYQVVWQAIEDETEKFKQSHAYTNSFCARKRASVSFQRGMSVRINRRLREMTDQRHEEEIQESPVVDGESTSLIVVKHNKVEEEFEKLSLGLRKQYSNGHKIDNNSYHAGREAGDKVNLRRPVGGHVVGFLTCE